MENLTYLGHATFLLTARSGVRLLIDPWISGNPTAPVTLSDLGKVDLVLVSHGAFDHLGDTLAILGETSAEAICCPAVRRHLLRHGVPADRVTPAIYGFDIERLGLHVKVVEAKHASIFQSGDDLFTGAALGFIISFPAGERVYFMGDTAIFGDLKLYAELYQPTIGLVPVGAAEGYHAELPPREAALATQWLDLPVAVPMHYGGATDQAEQYAALVRELSPRTHVITLCPGETYPSEIEGTQKKIER